MMDNVRTALLNIVALALVLALWSGSSGAAVIGLSASAADVKPGEDIAVDVVVSGIPEAGLNCVRFKLNIEAPGAQVAGVQDLSQSPEDAISVATPILMGPPSATRSGLGEFFYAGAGPNGVLSLENEQLAAGSSTVTFAHTYGAARPVGGGTVARLMFHVGNAVEAENFRLFLTDVALLDGGVEYELTGNQDLVVQLRCLTDVPYLAGMTPEQAQAALTGADLVLGEVYEVVNDGSLPTGVVLEQSLAPGDRLLCESAVNVAVNTAPAEVTQAHAVDKAGDETGAAAIIWTRSASQDTAGYRVYRLVEGGRVLVNYIGDADADSLDVDGLPVGIPTGFVIAAVDIYGNESTGAAVNVTALDDVPPVAIITGLGQGAYYNTDVTPSVDVSDAFLAEQRLTLNGEPYDLSPIAVEGAYVLSLTAVDASGNETTGSVSFVIDKTAPAVSVANLSEGGYYNIDVLPDIAVSDINHKNADYLLNGQPYVSGTIIKDEGYYTLLITAEDMAGNSSDLTLSFAIDKTSPSCSIAATEPLYSTESALYITGATGLVISASDDDNVNSGVGAVLYDIGDAGTWAAYESAFSLSGMQDGPYAVSYSVVDAAGNECGPNRYDVVVDNTPPVTDITVDSPGYTDEAGTRYISGANSFTLSADDMLSGVSSTEYRVDGGEWTAYVPFALAVEGGHLVEYRSSDKLGNIEAAGSLSVVTDNTPPVTTISVSEPKNTSGDGTLYMAGTSIFTLSASDNLAGVASTEYSVDGSEWTAYVPFSITSEGTHIVEYRSSDKLGNIETAGSLSVVTDNAPPVTAVTVGEPKHVAGDGTLYVASSTEIVLDAADNLSGVASIEYRVDEEDWTSYAPFALNFAGAHTIAYRSTDNLGNAEPAGSIAVVVDNTAPVTIIKAGEPNYTAADGTLYVNGTSTFTLETTDELSGPAASEYRLDGGEWTEYAPFVVPDEGAHTIEYKAADNLGNYGETGVLAVVVDNTPPVSAYSFEAHSYMDDGRIYLSPDSVVTLSAVDELSGVAGSYYRLDDGEYTRYTEPFTLAGLDYGVHVLTFYSVDNLGGSESEWSIPLTLMGVEVESDILIVPRVLVYTGGSGKPGQQDSDRAWMQWFIGYALKDMDAYYSLVYEKDDFINAFRSGIYNIYVVLDQSSPFSDVFISELKEAVNSSDGLLVSGWGNGVKEHLEGVLGVRFSGSGPNYYDTLTLKLNDSPVSYGRDLSCYGKPVETDLAGGTLAGILTTDASPNPVICATVGYNCTVEKGDLLEASLSNADKTIDREEITIGKLPVKGRIPDTLGSLEGNLSITGISATGITFQIKPYGIEQNYDYTLDVTLSRSGGIVEHVAATMDVSPESALDSGMKAGALDVVLVERMKANKPFPDKPGVVLNEYGLGRAAFMSFNMADAAKAGDTEGYAALLARTIAYLLPQEARTGPASVVLNSTELTLHGSDMDIVACETLDEGLAYMPLFGLCKELPLEYGLSLEDGVPSGYRYFVRTPDESGDYAIQTELSLSLSGATSPYGVYTHFINVDEDSLDVTAKAVEMFKSLKSEYPDRADAISDWLTDFEAVLLMPETTREDLDEEIHSVVMLVRRLDNLKVDIVDERLVLDEYLRILKSEYYMKN